MVLSHPLSSKRIKSNKVLLILFLVLGLLIFLLGAYQKYQKTILSFATPPPQGFSDIEERKEIPVRITIPDVNIDLPIKEARIIDGVWEVSETTASFLHTSARPGEGGNIVIYGHNKKKIFGELIGKDLVGKTIEINSLDNNKYIYEISAIKIVDPSNIAEVLPTENEVLTLYTCTSLFDSKRLVIKASPKDVSLN
jgi:LPXTG-site transpeptidase (sortase) family protein